MISLINQEYEPDVLISAYVNKNMRVEETRVLAHFKPGRSGEELRNEYDYCNDLLDNDDFFKKNNIKPDTLYHVYLHFNWYASGGYEYDEWDVEPIILNVTEVKNNYKSFLEAEEDYTTQEELKEKDRQMAADDFAEEYSYHSSSRINLSYNDLKKLINIVAKHNTRLAHRLVNNGELEKELGKDFDKRIKDIEHKRFRFKQFLKNNQNIRVRYENDGYLVKNEKYYDIEKKEIKISYDHIDSLEDDVLRGCSNEEILRFFYDSENILKSFEELEQESK
ncbi:hypothetical protein D3C87_79590 [compost metagenome]